MKYLKWAIPIFLILLLALWGYHFLAAGQAEQDIDEAIQEQAARSEEPVTIEYEAVEVKPFDGDVVFREANLVYRRNILRFHDLKLDLTYRDFLNIYWGGAEYGLEKLTEATIGLTDLSFVNRDSRMEISADSIHMRYSGNLMDGIRTLVTQNPSRFEHNYSIRAYAPRYQHASSPAGSFRTDSLDWASHFPADTRDLLGRGNHNLDIYYIEWAPPATFSERYGFFMRGLGYETDSVPFDSLSANLEAINAGQKQLKLNLYTEPFDTESSGILRWNEQSWQSSEIVEYEIRLTNPTEQVQNLIGNAEQMFDFQLERRDGNPTLQVRGTLSDIELEL